MVAILPTRQEIELEIFSPTVARATARGGINLRVQGSRRSGFQGVNITRGTDLDKAFEAAIPEYREEIGRIIVNALKRSGRLPKGQSGNLRQYQATRPAPKYNAQDIITANVYKVPYAKAIERGSFHDVYGRRRSRSGGTRVLARGKYSEYTPKDRKKYPGLYHNAQGVFSRKPRTRKSESGPGWFRRGAGLKILGTARSVLRAQGDAKARERFVRSLISNMYRNQRALRKGERIGVGGFNASTS